MLATQKQRDLFESGTSGAKKVARFMARRLRCKMYDVDDATQDSLMGLVKAAQDYDEAKANCPFQIYANTRCKQAVIDGWRKIVGRSEGRMRLNSALAFSDFSRERGGVSRNAEDDPVLSKLTADNCEPIDILISRSDFARKRRMLARIRSLAVKASRGNSKYANILTAIVDMGMSHSDAAALYGVSPSSVSNLFRQMRTEALCA